MKVTGVMVRAGLIETEQYTPARCEMWFSSTARGIISSLDLLTSAGYLHDTRIPLLCLFFSLKKKKAYLFSQINKRMRGVWSASQHHHSNSTSQVLCGHGACQPVFLIH